jgi:hypothetical protein
MRLGFDECEVNGKVGIELTVTPCRSLVYIEVRIDLLDVVVVGVGIGGNALKAA